MDRLQVRHFDLSPASTNNGREVRAQKLDDEKLISSGLASSFIGAISDLKAGHRVVSRGASVLMVHSALAFDWTIRPMVNMSV